MSAARRSDRRHSRGPDDDPVPVRDALGTLGRELGLPEPDALGGLTEHWAEVVGPEVADHARLRSVRDGVLTIAVDGAPWATELRYQEDTICRRVAEVTGADLVRSVRVVVEPPS
jgi:predicted nucleic acid-binding Zn ribbon protein